MPTQKSKLIFLTILSLAFFALSGEAQAAIFVDNNASGCSNGATNYNPSDRTCSGGSDTVYTTLNNAHSGVDAGSESSPRVINIRSGTEYSEKLDITKAWTTWQKYAGDSTRPVNNGRWTIVHEWKGLITIKATGVTIDGIEIKNTGHYPPTPPVKINNDRGYGIMANGANYATIKNCYTQFIGGSGINVASSDYVLLENNELYETEYSRSQGTLTSYASGINVRTGCDHIIIRGNYIHGCGGEGMNLNRKGEDFLIEYNTVCDAWAVAIFPNQIRDVIVRYNLVYHTGKPRFTRKQTDGIIVGAEEWPQGGERYDGYATDIDIYGNLIVGCHVPLGIGHVAFQSPYGYKVSYTRFYNNTVIEPFAGGSAVAILGRAGYTGNPIGSGVEFKNNIFWKSTDGNIATINSYAAGSVTWDYNLWSKAPSEASNARSSTDPRYPTYGAMSISDYFNKSSEWDNLTVGGLTANDFALKPTAREAINKGMTIPGYDNDKKKWNMLLDLNRTNFKEKIFPLVNQNNFGIWDIGAGVYGSGGDPPPSAPSELSVK